MIGYSELKKGTRILLKGQPYEIIESTPLFKGRGQSVLKTKVKNLKTGNVLSWTFRPSDTFEEPDLSKIKLKYIYSHPIRKSSISNGASRKKYFFSEKDNPSKRFELTQDRIGDISKFLKQNQTVEGMIFEEKLTGISLPIKITLKVTSTPPGIKGARAQPGTKTVTLETGAKINVPLFVKLGDTIEINTQSNEYVRRV